MKLNTNPLKGKYPITVRIAGLCGIFSLVLIFLVIFSVLGMSYSQTPLNIYLMKAIKLIMQGTMIMRLVCMSKL